jgi:signal transduction histidine kinase
VNLFINAIHAMPDGGTLTVKAFAANGSDKAGGGEQSECSEDGRDAVLTVEVEDTGTGIPPDKMAKIFDPFFTTKPTGVGTGLGLAVVRQIIDLHGGNIQITNKPQGGVRATVTLKTKGETNP